MGQPQLGQVNSSAVCNPGFTNDGKQHLQPSFVLSVPPTINVDRRTNDGNCTHYSIIATNVGLDISTLSRIII